MFIYGFSSEQIGLTNTQCRCDCATARAAPSGVCKQSECKDVFLIVQRLFTAERCLASGTDLTRQNEFRHTFSCSPELDKLTVSRLVTVSMTREACRTENVPSHQTRENVWMRASLNAIPRGGYNLVSGFLISELVTFLTGRTYVRNGLRNFSTTLWLHRESECRTPVTPKPPPPVPHAHIYSKYPCKRCTVVATASSALSRRFQKVSLPKCWMQLCVSHGVCLHLMLLMSIEIQRQTVYIHVCVRRACACVCLSGTFNT
jgi:hypothetical protein